jgi:hypothetical protein
MYVCRGSGGVRASAKIPQRYLLRTFILLIMPVAVTAYFLFLWRFLLSREQDSAFKYGISGEVSLYYLWFIISVLALEWSRYGLIGVESAMLETPLFSVPHTVGLLSHSDASWSGPGGWSKALTRFINRKGADTGRTRLSSKLVLILSTAMRPPRWGLLARGVAVSLSTYKLWYTLSLLSACLYIALPLSGLAMEMADGYIQVNERPMVVGRRGELRSAAAFKLQSYGECPEGAIAGHATGHRHSIYAYVR